MKRNSPNNNTGRSSVFDVTPAEAVVIQKELRDNLIQKPLNKEIKTIAGVDVSFNKYEVLVYAGIIVLSYPELEVIEYSCVQQDVHFPYVPGLLSFREIPPLLAAWKKLKTIPDVVVVDGHGIAHPRRLGIAAHFGLVTGVPTIGCGKSKLYGEFVPPAIERGSFSELIDPKTSEIIGNVLRTKNKVNPVFVSPGNAITQKEATGIILETAREYRLPEPTRLAHNLVNQFRRGELATEQGFE